MYCVLLRDSSERYTITSNNDDGSAGMRAGTHAICVLAVGHCMGVCVCAWAFISTCNNAVGHFYNIIYAQYSTVDSVELFYRPRRLHLVLRHTVKSC